MPNVSVNASAYPQNKEITVISVKGFIDTNTAPEFEKVFQAVLGEGKFNIIVNLKEASYISSAGWGIFVGEIKRIRNQKGDLFLVAMSPEVTEAYELLQFSTILKSFNDVDQAAQKGFAKIRTAKGPVKAAAIAQAEMSPQNNQTDQSAEEPFTAKSRNKPHWFFRILMPWTWF